MQGGEKNVEDAADISKPLMNFRNVSTPNATAEDEGAPPIDSGVPGWLPDPPFLQAYLRSSFCGTVGCHLQAQAAFDEWRAEGQSQKDQ